MARKTKQEAEETRTNILNAALDIIYDKGYARSTFVDIAKRINLTKGAVYWHFKNKPDLFLALGQEMEAKIDNNLESMLGEAGTLLELKRMLYEMILLISKDDQLRKYYTIVFLRMEWTEELLPVKQAFDRQDKLMMSWVVELLGNAQKNSEIPLEKDIKMLSRALLELVNGLLSYCLYESIDNNQKTAQIVQTGLDTYFMGMLVNEEQLKTKVFK